MRYGGGGVLGSLFEQACDHSMKYLSKIYVANNTALAKDWLAYPSLPIVLNSEKAKFKRSNEIISK